MACKRSPVRSRYSPPQKAATLVAAFFFYLAYNIHKGDRRVCVCLLYTSEACAGLNILHTETLGRQKSCVVRVPAETMAAKGLDVDCTSLPLQKVFVALCGHEQELQEHREG